MAECFQRVYMAQLKDEFEEYPNIKPCSRKTASTKTASSQAGSPNKNCRDLKEVKKQENYSESSGSGTPRGATGPLPPRTPRRRSIRDYLVINSPSSKTSSTRLPAKRTKDSDSPGDIKTLRPKRRLLTKCPRLSEGEDFPCGSPVAGASGKGTSFSKISNMVTLWWPWPCCRQSWNSQRWWFGMLVSRSQQHQCHECVHCAAKMDTSGEMLWFCLFISFMQC